MFPRTSGASGNRGKTVAAGGRFHLKRKTAFRKERKPSCNPGRPGDSIENPKQTCGSSANFAKRPNRLAAAQQTLRNVQTDLRRLSKLCESLKQTCGGSANFAKRPNRPAAAQQTLRNVQTDLRQLSKLCETPKQTCGSSANFATPSPETGRDCPDHLQFIIHN
jgi:hypothetical protein